MGFIDYSAHKKGFFYKLSEIIETVFDIFMVFKYVEYIVFLQ
jgi:hypothetical protein